EDLQRRPDPVLGLRLQADRVLAGPGDRRSRAPEVEPGRDLLLRLPEGVVDLLPVDLADDVERRVRCHVLSPDLFRFRLVTGVASALWVYARCGRDVPTLPVPAWGLGQPEAPVCASAGEYRYPCLR